MRNIILAFAVIASTVIGAAPVFHPWHYQNEIIENGLSNVVTQWKFVEKDWRPRVKTGKKWKGDFVPYDEHFDKWVIITTNKITRPISVKARNKFRDKLDEMEPGYKRQKAIEKAAQKWSKNIDKVRKNFEKYIKKTASDEEREFWQALLDSLQVQNTED